jgi:cysteine synthase A
MSIVHDMNDNVNAMPPREDLLDAIGNTPLLRLRGPSDATGCEILGKCEFMNPGGSVKDRAAKYMVLDAEARGVLGPGGVIVEGTAGNTGIGLALVGNARGYRTVITMPDTQSQEKKDALRLMGAEIHAVPAVPFSDPENYVHVAERLAGELAETTPGGVLYANQWDNPANGDGHFRSTGPEIWAQTAGSVDAFCCAIGTGGTLSGVGRYLKSRNPDIAIAVTDPLGSCMYHWFRDHRMERTDGGSISEGIGQGRETGNVAQAPVDLAFAVSDEDALPVVFDLLQHEGLCLGGSSGINVAGAMQLARHLGPGHTIVTILCDFGQRYQSKLWNPAFLAQRGLPVPSWL